MKRSDHLGAGLAPGTSRKRFAAAIAIATIAAAFVLVSAPAANADTTSIDFNSPTYATGSIDAQNGWAGTGGAAINPTYDQSVVATGMPGFADQSFRMSNAVTSGSFGDWPFSPSLNNEAGEATADNGGLSGGTRQPHFEATWDFASMVPGSEQAGLQISASPDRGDGARMSFIRLLDTPTGLSVVFSDYRDAAPFGSVATPTDGCSGSDDFVTTTVASGLDRTAPHTVKLAMDLFDGARNDVVQVFVDGELVHTGTSWEDYYRWCEGTATSRTVDSMLFQARTSGGTASGTFGKGFLIDNLTTTSGPTSGISTLGVCPVSVAGTTPVVYTLLADCVTDQTIVVPQNTGGSVFDGNGFSITGVDPSAGHFLGAVVQAEAGTHAITVKNLTVTVSNLTDACDDGANRLRGILFDGVSGTIKNNAVTDLEQGATGESGCQEGNGIEVRNAPFAPDAAGPRTNVTMTGNTVTDYQKGGIVANGSVAATIKNNTVIGDGKIDYIAQNGLQVAFNATALVKSNSSSGNWYTPPGTTACGFLIYQANGVRASNNTLFKNEKNLCNFGKGGGVFRPSTP